MLAGERKYCDARREYEDNELLRFYVRGMFAGMNTAFIRQNFARRSPRLGMLSLWICVFLCRRTCV